MIEDTNRLLSAVLETMREGVVVVDSTTSVVLFNDAATRIVKLPPEGAVNHRDEALVRPALQSGPQPHYPRPFRLVDATRDPVINAAFRKAIEERVPVEIRVEMADIEARCFQLNVAPLGQDLAVGVFFDITELERLERVRREFFANLSHELRTPLTAVLAYSETLLRGALEDPEHNLKFLEKLHKHAARMSELISDISDLSAIESGRVRLALGPVRLQSVAAEVLAVAETRESAKGIRFENLVPPEIYVSADRTRLEQILNNLVDNAAKFNRPGGLVVVRAFEHVGQAVIDVEDDGPGIAAPDLPRVFERFYRVDKSRSRRIEGSGLGLAIVKHLVQAHEGEISAASELGRGSKFTLTLPLDSRPAAADREKASSAEA